MKSAISNLLIILFTLTLYSCEDKGEECELPLSVYDTFGFEFRNTNGVDALKSLSEDKKNKITFTRKDGKAVDINFNTTLNTFFLRIIDAGEKPNGEVAKTFYINFSDIFGGEIDDIDTLNFNYELIYQDDRCTPVWFEHIKINYNDSLYYTGNKIPFMYYKK